VIEKKLLVEEEITEQFIRELKIQMFLNHPNIIKMYGYFDDDKNIYIILEVGTGGQLYHYLKKNPNLPEPKVAFLMKQICEAVN
jgi:aurora kinase